MTDTTTTPDESNDEQFLTTRRKVVGALAAAGVLGASASAQSGGQTNLSAGGGSMADAYQEYRIKAYVGTKSERPSAGVEGRVWEVHDPGGTDHGAVYYDDGGSWQLVSRMVESITLADTA